MINMNLKKYEKFRKNFGYKPVEWLDFSIREHNFCRNHQIRYIDQLIDADINLRYRGFGLKKNFRFLTATLKRKLGSKLPPAEPVALIRHKWPATSCGKPLRNASHRVF